MNITHPLLTEAQNTEFNELLVEFGNGFYWENEGWTDEHSLMRPQAEQALQEFLNKHFNSTTPQ